MNPTIQNPNDLKIVTFHNKTDFGFTPEMGCMFNSNPINGLQGIGIAAGESIQLPYHVGKLLAMNLAKRVLLNNAPLKDQAGTPQGVPIWDDAGLQRIADSFVTELYMEKAQAPVSEADKMMAKIEELKKAGYFNPETTTETKTVETVNETTGEADAQTFSSKADILAELEKRGIKHDKRSSKETLAALLS